MDVIISDTKKELGQKAAVQGAELIREAIAIRGEANIVVATGHHNNIPGDFNDKA